MVWQPGIRLFHSTDLANWTLVGHALVRGEHELRGLDFNAGIWAPSLTYDPAAGLFYVAYSLVRSTTADYFDVDNFVVTATDIAGPWSAPAYLQQRRIRPVVLPRRRRPALGRRPWNGIRGTATSIPAPSCSRSSTPSSARSSARPAGSTAEAATGAAWKARTCTSKDG